MCRTDLELILNYPGVRGGEVLPTVDYTGNLRSKGVPLSGWRKMKGQGLRDQKYRKGYQEKLSSRYSGGRFKLSQTDAPAADSSQYLRGYPSENFTKRMKSFYCWYVKKKYYIL